MKKIVLLGLLLAAILSIIAGCGGSGRSGSNDNPTQDPTLVAYYPFDGNANDASGGGHNGTVSGDTKLVAGKVGQAYSFDGDEDQITIAQPPNLSNLNTITVACWIKPVANRNSYIISGAGFAIGQSVDTSNILGVEIRHGVAMSTWEAKYTSINPGDWCHFAGTYDGNYIRVYLNGSVVAVAAHNNSLDKTIYSSGSLTFGDSALNGDWLGTLDEVRIYNRVLSETEIKELSKE